MIENESSKVLLNGQSVFTKVWQPDDGKARANIILIHGIGEHCGRYTHVARFLTDAGFAVYAFDHLGHGRSDGKRGCMSYAQAYEIVSGIKEELHAKEPQTPIFIYGHSMGGGIALSYGIQFPDNLKGGIITSPAVGMANPLPAPVVFLLRGLEKIAPNFTISNGLSLDGLSHAPNVIRKYSEDPLTHDKVSVKLGLDLIDYGKFLQHFTETYPIPLFFAQGSKDRLVDPVAAEKFAQNTKGSIEYFRVEGGYHELHNEPDRQPLFDAMLAWLEKQLSA